MQQGSNSITAGRMKVTFPVREFNFGAENLEKLHGFQTKFKKISIFIKNVTPQIFVHIESYPQDRNL